MNIVYDSRVGQYRGDKGRLVSRASVLEQVDLEVARMSVRYRGHARLLVAGRISIEEFQLRMAQDLKLTHIRLASLAIGGVGNLNPTFYGMIGRMLREQYVYLRNFGAKLETGELESKRIIERASLYAAAGRTAFFRAEKEQRKRETFNQAKRSLDPQSKHCLSCLKLTTKGQWLPIDAVTPPGINCLCRARCRCRISYRRFK